MIMEDPRISVKESERVLGAKPSTDLLDRLKTWLVISHRIHWYGLDTEFVLSPSGNYASLSASNARPRTLAVHLGP